MSVTTRFAPSPTGRIHLGNARTALFNWLVARRDDGRFLVRVEDTDAARAVPGGADAVLEDLAWLGLAPSEPPWFQSRRMEIHAEALERLHASGRVYPCFCSEAALKSARRAQAQANKPPRYPGTCAGLAADEAARRVEAGESHTLRFRVPDGRALAFEDRVHGTQSFASDDIGDFVVRRSDGTPAFFFANALDDALAGITLVLRGDDHLSNTPRQMLILEALDLPVPEYGHLPLVLREPGGEPLSKRVDDALSVSSLREMGYHPLALANYLARVGGHVDGHNALGLDGLVAAFDPRRFNDSPAAYDENQLQHWQRDTLDALDAKDLWAWMGEPVHARVPEAAREAFIALVRPNALFPGDALDWAFVLFDDAPQPEKGAIELVRAADAALFDAALAAYDDGMEWSAWIGRVKDATGLKGAALLKPLRAALTGRINGPDLSGIFALLEPRRIRDRLATKS